MKPESGRSEVIGWIICLSRGTTSPHWFHPTTIRCLITTRCAYRIRSQSAEKTKATTNIHNFNKMGKFRKVHFPKKSRECQHGKLRLPQNTLGIVQQLTHRNFLNVKAARYGINFFCLLNAQSHHVM